MSSWDLSKFKRSIELMAKLPGKHGPDVLNKAVEKITIGSKGSRGLVHLTKRAAAERIRADLNRPAPGGGTLLIRLAVISLKRKGIHSANRTLLAKARSRGQARTIVNNWRTMVKAEARRILAARLRSRGFIVAGWLHALAKLRQSAGMGASGGRGVNMFPSGEAAQSYARTATPHSLVSGLFNTSEGAGVVSSPSVIQAAINSATADNIEYLTRKLGDGIKDALK